MKEALEDLARVLVAALFVFGVIASTFVVLLPLGGMWPEWAISTVPGLVAVVAIIVACILFNRREQRWPSLSIEEMRARGLVESQAFEATRALQVEEYEDEGLHFFIELSSKQVLLLSGQYLYEYEPIEDDPDLNQARLFPNTHFIVHRHRERGYALSIEPLGAAFEPELLAPAFSFDAWRNEQVPEDGQILTESFDEIKQRLERH